MKKKKKKNNNEMKIEKSPTYKVEQSSHAK